MATRYIKLSAGASNVMTTSVTKMQIFIELKNFEGNKIAFKRSYDKHDHFISNFSWPDQWYAIVQWKSKLTLLLPLIVR